MGEPLIRKWFSLTADRLGEAKWQNLRHIQQVTDWERKVNLVREVIKAGPSALVTYNAPNPRIRPRVIGLSLSHLFTGYVYRCDPNRIHYSPREAARLSMPRQKPSIRARGPWLWQLGCLWLELSTWKGFGPLPINILKYLQNIWCTSEYLQWKQTYIF